MFIRLIVLGALMYVGYLGTQTESLSLGGLEGYRELLIAVVIAVLATPLLTKLLR